MTDTLAATPLAAWHREYGATTAPFAGYEMPIRYSSIVEEHQACRDSGVLFDVSHMARLRFEGERADQFLDRVLSRRIEGMPVGAVRYGLICNEQGGILDDVLVSHLETPSGTRYFLMVVNASNHQKIVAWLTDQLTTFPTVTMTDRTELTAMIAVQGPRVLEATAKLFQFDPRRLKYYRAAVTEQMGKPVIVSRTGYTGEEGLELIVRAEDATRVWENVLLAGREHAFLPAGLGARDTLRLEAAMPLYGHELDETIDPITAGLRFAVSLKDNRQFNGSQAIRRVAEEGPTRQRVGLVPRGRRPAREGCAVYSSAGDKLGSVTSGAPSPTLGHPIAMAFLDTAAQLGDEVWIDIRGKQEPAEIVRLPFYKRS
jgi:aminomethyltransferase